MDSVDFTDQIHIEQIKKRLWCGREFGQAAVMIGAGFSRNADTASYNAPSFLSGRNLQVVCMTLYIRQVLTIFVTNQ